MVKITPHKVFKAAKDWTQSEIEGVIIALAFFKNSRTMPQGYPLELLGVDYDTPTAKRNEQIQYAHDRGIYATWREEWEIVQFGDAVAAERDSIWIEHIHELGVLTDYLQTVERLVGEILGYVSRTRGNLWTFDEETKRTYYPFSETDAGDISKAYAQLIIVFEGLGGNLAAFEQANRITIAPRVMDGIRELINNHNDKPLRTLAQEFINLPAAAREYLEKVKLPGAPSKQAVVDRLCQRAAVYYLADSDKWDSWRKITAQVSIDLMKAESDDEIEEFEQLNNWSNAEDRYPREFKKWQERGELDNWILQRGGLDNRKKVFSDTR